MHSGWLLLTNLYVYRGVKHEKEWIHADESTRAQREEVRLTNPCFGWISDSKLCVCSTEVINCGEFKLFNRIASLTMC